MEKKSRKDNILTMLKTEPHDVFLNYALAMEFLGEKDFINADLQLQKTLRINEEYLPCFYQLGQLNEKLNNTNLAIQFYSNGIELAKKQENTKALGELKEALWLLED